MNPYDSIARFYDLEHSSLTADATLYTSLIEMSNRDILILGVGTGRLIGPFLDAGARVLGIDSSEAMLSRAVERFKDDSSVSMVGGDIASFRIERSFNAVIVPFDVLSMLETQTQQVAALSCVRDHLAQSGRLIVDVVNPLVLPTQEQCGIKRERFHSIENGIEVRAFDSVEIDVAEQRMLMTVWYEQMSKKGRDVLETEIPVRWVYRYELEALVRAAGLIPQAAFGDYDCSPYGEISPRLIMTATAAPLTEPDRGNRSRS